MRSRETASAPTSPRDIQPPLDVVPEPHITNESYLTSLLNRVNEIDWAKAYDKLAPYVGIALLISALNLEGRNRQLCCTIALVVIGTGPLRKVATQLYNHVIEIINNEEDGETQSSTDIIKFLAVSAWTLYSGAGGDSMPLKVTNYIKSFGKLSVPFDVLFEKIVRMFNTLFDGILERFGLMGGSISRRMDQFMAKCKRMIDKFEGDQLPRTQMMSGLIDEAIKEGESIVTSDQKLGGYALNYYLRKLYAIRESYATRKLTASGLRVEPVFTVFRGAPGLGKTGVIQHLADACVQEYLKRIKDEECLAEFDANPNVFTFNRTVESKYWEGYDFRKIITFFDDLGQQKDVAGNLDNEWMNIIRAVNEHEFACHMATLSKKSDTYFLSKYVFATTNLAEFKPQSVLSEEAITRRIDFDVVVFPKKEYTTPETIGNSYMSRKLDKSKLPRGVYTSRLSPDLLDFGIKAPDGTLDIVSYDDLVLMMCEKQLCKEEFFQEKLLSKKDHLSRLAHSFDEFHAINEVRIDRLYAEDLENDIQMEYVEPQVGEFDDHMVPTEETSSAAIRAANLQTFFRQCNQEFLQDYLSNRENDEDYHGEYDFARKLEIAYPLLFQYVRLRLRSSGVPLGNVDRCIENFGRRYILDLLRNRQEYVTEKGLYGAFIDEVSWEEMYDCFVMPTVENVKFQFAVLKSRIEDYFSQRPNFLDNMYDNWIHMWHMNRGMIYALCGVWILAISMVLKLVYDYFFGPVSKKKAKAKRKAEERAAANSSSGEKNGEAQAIDIFDEQTNRVLEKILRENAFNLIINYGDGTSMSLGQVLFVKTGFLLLPQHFIMMLKKTVVNKDGASLTLESGANERLNIIIDYRDFEKGFSVEQPLAKKDLGIVYLPGERSMRDVSKYFCEEKDLQMGSYDAALLRRTLDGVTYQLVRAHPNMLAEYKSPLEHGGDSWSHKAFCYNAATRKGQCGMLLVDVGTKKQVKKILGIHVAGVPSIPQGYSCSVTQEDLCKLQGKLEMFDALPGEVQCASSVLLEDKFVITGNLTKYPKQFGKSEYRKTPMYDTLGPAKKSLSLLHPVVRNGVQINPLYKGFENYSKPDCDLDMGLVRKCFSAYFYKLERCPITFDKKIMTQKEIIFGIDGDNAFKSINRQSSMGYPWNCEKVTGFKGKEFIFGKDSEFDIDNQNFRDIMKIVEEKERLLLNGIRPEFLFVDNVKDEKLAKEKVLEGKSRLFSACPFDLLYLTRKYFGAFCVFFNRNKIHNGAAIGLNCYGPEWDILARSLLMKGINPNSKAFGAGDYSKFDGSLKNKILWEICHLINRWYGDSEENQKIRRHLWYEVVNSRHVVGDIEVMWINSLPSGHPLTSVINSIYNNIAIRFCWARINGCLTFLEITLFDKHVCLITLGDDNLFAVSPMYQNVFTEAKIAEHMKELGLNYTSDTKDGVNLTLRTFEEVSFLKRKFRYEPRLERYVAPLDFDTTMQISYFCKKSKILEDAVMDNVDTTVKELAFYGEDVFNEHVALIKEALGKKMGPSLHPFSDKWEDALDVVTSEQPHYI